MVHHYVDQARAKSDASGVRQLAIDATSARGGQDYITLFVDIEKARVRFATGGKDANTVAAFADDVAAHGGDPANIAEVCIDMSAAFIKGVSENLRKAEITFDKFHAVKIINAAVDAVRREEVKSRPELKQSRYVWLKNETNLSSGQRQARASLAKLGAKAARVALRPPASFQCFQLLEEGVHNDTRVTGGLIARSTVLLSTSIRPSARNRVRPSQCPSV